MKKSIVALNWLCRSISFRKSCLFCLTWIYLSWIKFFVVCISIKTIFISTIAAICRMYKSTKFDHKGWFVYFSQKITWNEKNCVAFTITQQYIRDRERERNELKIYFYWIVTIMCISIIKVLFLWYAVFISFLHSHLLKNCW